MDGVWSGGSIQSWKYEWRPEVWLEKPGLVGVWVGLDVCSGVMALGDLLMVFGSAVAPWPGSAGLKSK